MSLILQTITYTDSKYPDLLKGLAKFPRELRVCGEIPASSKGYIAVVGSRKMSEYGKDVVNSLVAELIDQGHVLVSGMAPGIDSLSQKLALQLGGKTIGVLGFGFNHLKSMDSLKLSRAIVEKKAGAVVSPYPDGQKPSKWTFIQRNKVIAGLANCVLVVESTKRSGAHHTVNASLELNREVYAVPGSIFSVNSVGNHDLLKDGAKMACKACDLFI